MSIKTQWITLALCVSVLATGSIKADEPALIPREVLFGNPQRSEPQISPDGAYISYLAPRDGVMNVFVAPRDDVGQARPITNDRKRGIRTYQWTHTGKDILYIQDAAGDENWHVYVVDIKTAETRDLTPIDGVQGQILSVNESFPDRILVGINDRDPQLHDVYSIDLESGERTLVEENQGTLTFLTDHRNQVRLAVKFSPDGGMTWLKKTSDGWKPSQKIGPADSLTSRAVSFNKAGDRAYIIDSRDRNTAALYKWNLNTDEKILLAENERADVAETITHPSTKELQAVAFRYDRKQWKVLDDAIADDLDYLKSVEDGELAITSRSLDDRWWTVSFTLDNGPVKYYLYDSENKSSRFLFANRDDLDSYTLAKMHPVEIPTRDGLTLVSYLTLPVDSDNDGDARPAAPLPMVLFVHGGPWGRDNWGYNPFHQWMANRGYAVLSVNYRGSTGFGKDFVNAANGQWSRKMHDDLIDAVQWAKEQKIAAPKQVAIAGGSYGGYATLVGLTFTPDVFACGVDIVGPSNLVTLLNNVPPYWMPEMPLLKDRIADNSTKEGIAELKAMSPLFKADQIKRPLLIGQGANDPRVKQQESDQIVAALKENDIPVTYVLYPDEGHGFRRPENMKSFTAVWEAFLAKHLGGRFQPVGKDFEGSSIEIPEGAGDIPGIPRP